MDTSKAGPLGLIRDFKRRKELLDDHRLYLYSAIALFLIGGAFIFLVGQKPPTCLEISGPPRCVQNHPDPSFFSMMIGLTALGIAGFSLFQSILLKRKYASE